MRTREWDYLCSRIKKILTIPAYLVMIKNISIGMFKEMGFQKVLRLNMVIELAYDLMQQLSIKAAQ